MPREGAAIAIGLLQSVSDEEPSQVRGASESASRSTSAVEATATPVRRSSQSMTSCVTLSVERADRLGTTTRSAWRLAMTPRSDIKALSVTGLIIGRMSWHRPPDESHGGRHPTANGFRLDVGVLAGVRSRRSLVHSRRLAWHVLLDGIGSHWAGRIVTRGTGSQGPGRLGCDPDPRPGGIVAGPLSDRGIRGTSVDSERHVRTTIGGCGSASDGARAQREGDHVGGVHAGVALGAAPDPRTVRHPIESIRPGSLRSVGAADPQRGLCAGWSPLPVLRGAGGEHRPRHAPLARWGTHMGERRGGMSPVQSPRRDPACSKRPVSPFDAVRLNRRDSVGYMPERAPHVDPLWHSYLLAESA